MTVTLGDPLAALCAYLSNEIGSQLGTNSQGAPAVYRPMIPMVKAEMKLMPQKAIAVRFNGGVNKFAGSRMLVSTPRVNVSCYGSNHQDANTVAVAVFGALKALVMQSWENVMLYSAIPQSPIPLPDEQTLWSTSVVVCALMHRDYTNS